MRVSGEGARRILAAALGDRARFAPPGTPPLGEIAIRIDSAAAAPRAVVRAGPISFDQPVDIGKGLAALELGEALARAGCPRDGAAAIAARAAEAWEVFARAEALALDAKIAGAGEGAAFLASALVIDPRALPRQAWLEACLGAEGADSLELALWREGIDYVPLGGDLGLLCIGAGMTLAMLDRLHDAGLRPCAFLDVTRNYSVEGIGRALEVLLRRHGARAIAVNVFGGITRMDELAANLAQALARKAAGVPVCVRLEGTGGEAGRAALARAGIPVAGSSAEVVAFAAAAARDGTP